MRGREFDSGKMSGREQHALPARLSRTSVLVYVLDVAKTLFRRGRAFEALFSRKELHKPRVERFEELRCWTLNRDEQGA